MEACDFGRILCIDCHKSTLKRTIGLSDFSKLDKVFQEVLIWRSGLRNQEKEISSICDHHLAYFGNTFEKKFDKCCDVYMCHKKRVKGKFI